MVNPNVLESLSVVGITEGRSFISAYWFQDIDKDTDTTRNIIVENPEGSGVAVALTAPRIIPTGSITVQGYKNVTVDVAGTTIDTVNSRTDGSDSAIANVQRGVEFSGGVPYPKQEFPAGNEGTFGSGGREATDNAILITPGNNFLTQVDNVSPATVDVTVEKTFTETDEKNIPTEPWSP